jgi:formylglycine-generating enzyme required for sulfatase activity
MKNLPSFLLLLALPCLCNAQNADPGFCRELLGKAHAALQKKDWNATRDYCETALPLCPGIAAELAAAMKQATDGVDGEKIRAKKSADEAVKAKKQAVKNEELAKKREADAKAALAELEQKNAHVVRLILENADRDVLNLRYEDALEKIKAAASIGAIKEETARHFLEIAFWHGETGNPARAAALLDSAAALVNKKAFVKQPFRASIQAFDTLVFKKLMERYYPVMLKVEGGAFDMGCDPEIEKCYSDRNDNLHPQTVSTFQIAKYETTWWQYLLFCKATGHDYKSPGWGTDGDNPAVNVSWFDAVLYANWVNVQFGLDTFYLVENKRKGTWSDFYDVTLNTTLQKGYRLPTEAEWEYAAKGGKYRSPFVFSGGNEIDTVAWYGGNSGSRTRPVGGRKANALGLHDMSGNVWEWCWDRHGDYEPAPDKDYKGPPDGSDRVLRGGGWDNVAGYCRAANRYRFTPVTRFDHYGFRLVFVP